MLKKILYVIVALVIGFVMFYLSWRNAYSKAVVNKGNDALERNDYEFFCKFLDYYEKEPVSVLTYTENNNTTTIRAYNVFTKNAKDEDGNKTTRSGLYLLITDINVDVIHVDENEPSEMEDDEATKLTVTSDLGTTSSCFIYTYGYESAPIVLHTLSVTDLIKDLTKDGVRPTKISHISITDSSEKKELMLDLDVNYPLVEHNDEEYWTKMVDDGLAGTSFTQKEWNKNFSFSFPEMNQVFLVTGITLLILIGLGVFIFWPKKSFVPTEDEDREKYTYAPTEEKEKYALAKIARDKKEKEDRENRYKNVRTESSLEKASDEAIKKSMDQENTFEKAIEEDKALEEQKEEKPVVEETEDSSSNETEEKEIKEEN